MRNTGGKPHTLSPGYAPNCTCPFSGIFNPGGEPGSYNAAGNPALIDIFICNDVNMTLCSDRPTDKRTTLYGIASCMPRLASFLSPIKTSDLE